MKEKCKTPNFKELTDSRTHRKHQKKKKLTTRFITVKFKNIRDKENILKDC